MHWRHSFPEAYLENLCCFHSDHAPILLRCAGRTEVRRHRPFRFQAAWVSHSDYGKVVEDSWANGNGDVGSSMRWVQEESRIFNSNIFGSILQRKRVLEARINGIQRNLEHWDSLALMRLDLELRSEYEEVLVQEELLWFQKSRENWAQLGDQNTKFFHTQTLVRRKKNKIHGPFLEGGAWCTDLELLEGETIWFYKNLFSSTGIPDVDRCHEIGMPMLLKEERLTLMTAVTIDEVRGAVMSMQPFKALGSDGFHAFFYKQFWNVVGNDVCRLAQTAFSTGHFDPALAKTLLVLIPKVDNPNHLKNFRPISLCNVIYKIVTKVLVNRIRAFLPRIVSPLQGSFIPRRGTLDNIILAQEMIHWMHRKQSKKGAVAFKLDLEKAYDRVEWSFLEATLQDFGFLDMTIKLIMHCVRSSNFSIL